jgi:predicted GH43/DUF377 family glycosyl hydrolase
MGPPPVETQQGWLVIYHGVRDTVAGGPYRAGLALLELENPARVLRRSEEWVLGPQAQFEVTGDVPNVVSPCGLVHDHDNDTLLLSYCAADTRIGLATARSLQVLDYILPHGPSADNATRATLEDGSSRSLAGLGSRLRLRDRSREDLRL